MLDRGAKPAAASATLVLSCLLAAGCAAGGRARTTEPVQPVPPVPPATSIPVAGAPTTPVPSAEVTTAAVVSPEAQPTPSPSPTIQAAQSTQPAPASRVAVPKAPVKASPVNPPAPPRPPPKPLPKPAPAVQSAPAPIPQVMPKAPSAPVVAPPSAPTLDFKSLETRLRQTKAIGVLTKLSLKNQIDDLLAGFRAYHRRQGTATLADLRRNYDMLVLKVLALLQDSDPALARDIARSRAAIWSILEDPRKFTESNLMAGATP